MVFFFFFKQKTAYEMRISDWSSDVCSSDLRSPRQRPEPGAAIARDRGAVRAVSRRQESIDRAGGCERREARRDLPALPGASSPDDHQRGSEDPPGGRSTPAPRLASAGQDRKSTRLNSSH